MGLNCVALIPARSGSKRIPDKNIYPLGGHPLIAYTIVAALESKVFSSVIVSTDSAKYARIARYYGAEVVMRPKEYARDDSPDIEWVYYTLLPAYDCFSILRPTSPFRTAETIKRAWAEFYNDDVDSIRAVEKCSQHPFKMWMINRDRMSSLFKIGHSLPYQSLPVIYVQNASLEIAWSSVVFDKHSISGDIVKPFFTKGYEGFDINQPYDIKYAEWLIETKQVILPDVKRKSILR